MEKPNKPKRTAKACPECKVAKPLAEFVTVYGSANPRGKYCGACFLKHQRQHAISLMDGRDFCLYCGIKVDRYSDFSPDGRSVKTYIHRDHMDPVSLGGHDMIGVVALETGEVSMDDRNLVYCCAACNLKKSDMPFVEWLETLKPEHQELARVVYAEKHDGKSPEDFIPNEYFNKYGSKD